jgi:hypothetical protein
MSLSRENSALAILENQKRKEKAALSEHSVKGGVSRAIVFDLCIYYFSNS